MYKLTQKQRILRLLEKRGERGAFVYEFMKPRPEGLGIAQYNARIKELREKGYNIVNTKPGHFVLEPNEPETTPEEFMDWTRRRQEELDRKERAEVGNEPQMGLF